MNTDAFKLIGKLMENGVISEILFTKKGFRVRFRDEKGLFHYRFDDDSIISFIELYETYE